MNSINEFLDKIFQADAIEFLKKIPSNSVDMCFADPPFNLGKKYNSYFDKKKEKEYIEWARKWLYELVRITKPTGSIFVHNIPKWLTHFANILNEFAIFRHWISWDAMGAPLGKTLLPNHYGILYYVKSNNFKFYDIRVSHSRCRNCGIILKDYGGKKHLIHPFGPLASDVWTDIHRIRHKKRRDEHPCQLPEHLVERLILMTTDEGDIILDPFIGTGTTAVAAKKLGRHFIGIDIDPYYVKLSENKLQNVKETKIGNCYVSVFLNKIVTIRDKDWDKIKDYFIIPPNLETKQPKLKQMLEFQLDLFIEKK
ncbi:site-specific DNA-methyltransferase (adenine-specific) [Candidatus Kryptobacter tengchongensis]|nr:site-specific DNA-methyltransferase (adenine-specific) [Candidatus Kryptobacter tengchongensis]CUU07855.1 site-specific DNA-methyltransferase (adenine-specific) [Candidatus Kryptobacter tengchongensis]